MAARVAERSGLPANRVYLFIDPQDRENYVSTAAWTDIWSPAEDVASWTWKTITTAEEAQNTTAILNYSSGWVYTSTHPSSETWISSDLR